MLTLASLFPTQQGGRPHSLCDNDAYDSEENYAKVTKFRATGSVTLEAFSYLWKRAKNLEELRISGMTPAGPNLDNRLSFKSLSRTRFRAIMQSLSRNPAPNFFGQVIRM